MSSRKWLVCKAIGGCEHVPECNITASRSSFKANFFEMDEFPKQPLKNLIMILIKLACFFKRFSNQRQEAICQLFGWTSAGPSKCPIDKMIGWQSHMSISPSATLHNPEALSKLSGNSLTKIFWKSLKFKIRRCRNFQCPLSKISLHFQTDWLEANCLSPTVQLDFSWTLEMSDQQNDWLSRPSESLKSSLTVLCRS